MKLGTLDDLILALGRKVSSKYATALKQAALDRVGRGPKYFDIDAVIAWKGANPNWKMTDQYPASPDRRVSVSPSRSRKGRRLLTSGKVGARS